LPRYLALTLGPHPVRGEPDRVLEAVWQHHRERLMEDETTPWGFFAFECPGDPRGERPALHPVSTRPSASSTSALDGATS
jgi:hypothetical protein